MGQRLGPLAAAPAIDQRAARGGVVVLKERVEHGGNVVGDVGGPNFSSLKRVAFVVSTDFVVLVLVKHG